MKVAIKNGVVEEAELLAANLIEGKIFSGDQSFTVTDLRQDFYWHWCCCTVSGAVMYCIWVWAAHTSSLQQDSGYGGGRGMALIGGGCGRVGLIVEGERGDRGLKAIVEYYSFGCIWSTKGLAIKQCILEIIW